jgi:hypothetical protein
MTTPKPPTPQGARYHYILTLRAIRTADDIAVAHSHASGTYEPGPGQTRADVFTDLLGQEVAKLAADGFGVSGHKPVVLFLLARAR